jgi:hypothetical protein
MHSQGDIAVKPAGRLPVYHGRRLILALFAVSLFFLPLGVPAADDTTGAFKVIELGAEKGDEAYLLNAQMDITLSSGPREALENGVPLVFELQIQTLENHVWIWDSVIAEYKQTRQVQFHALSRTYLVKDIDTGAQRSYTKLADALRAAGFVHNFPVLDYGLMKDGQSYSVRLRGSLDIEALPTPVRLLAYVSSAWDMDTEWYKWQLTQ